MVSIITPSFNQGQFIEDTILSVKQQNYPNIEHIIVDGNSTDNTLQILRKYEDTYNMRWISEPDEGMYEAINKGLRMSNGEFLAYLNTDDLYFPWTVRTAVDYLKNNPSVDLVYGDMLRLNWNTNEISLVFYPPFNLGYIRRTGFLGQPTVFWRRKVTKRLGGFDETLKFVADCDYWMKAGATFNISKISEFMAAERDHPSAKRFAERNALRYELSKVRARYCTPSVGQRYLGSLTDRIWSNLWQRAYLAKFLFYYLLDDEGERKSPWSNFLRLSDSQFRSLTDVLIGFLPFRKARIPSTVLKSFLEDHIE